MRLVEKSYTLKLFESLNAVNSVTDPKFKELVLRDFQIFIEDKYNVQNVQELGDRLEHVSEEDINDYFTGMFYEIVDTDDMDSANVAEKIIRKEFGRLDTFKESSINDATDLSFIEHNYEYPPDVGTMDSIDHYFKLLTSVHDAECYNYRSDYWGTAEGYQEDMVNLMYDLESDIGKPVKFGYEENGKEEYMYGTLLGVAIDKQYNSISHAKIIIEPTEAPEEKTEETVTESASDRYQVREFDGPGAKFGIYDTKQKKFIQKGSKKVMIAGCDELNKKANLKESSNVIWTSEITADDYDQEDLKANQYQDYLDDFDGTIKPEPYEEWLDSTWLYNYLYHEFNSDDNEYEEWGNFILNYDDGTLKRYYQDYLDDINEREPSKPKSFEDWFDDYMIDDSGDMWSVFEEDLKDNVLPMIDKQVNGAIFVTGNYNSNYPEFRKSGAGGKIFADGDAIIDWASNNDGLEFTDNDGVIGIRTYDHDGSISGLLYTLPQDRKEIIEIAKSTNYYDPEDYEYADDIYDDFMYDLANDNVSMHDIEKTDTLVPIKNLFTIEEAEQIKLNKLKYVKDKAFDYYHDKDKNVYAKNKKSKRLYQCTDEADPEIEIEDDSKYKLKEATRYATNIDWETDGDDEAKKELPKKVEIPQDVTEDTVADWLSDKYGWLVNSVSITESANDTADKKPNCVIFYLNGKELAGHDLKNEFEGERESARELLAYENSVKPEDIEVRLEYRESMNESVKSKKSTKKQPKENKRVIMQQGNVTCFKENDNTYYVFENENDNEVEHNNEESAMQDFLERVGVDPNQELQEAGK